MLNYLVNKRIREDFNKKNNFKRTLFSMNSVFLIKIFEDKILKFYGFITGKLTKIIIQNNFDN